MTTATLAPTVTEARLSLGGVVRSEWIKLRSLRSTWWCFALIAALTVGFGLLLALTFWMPDGEGIEVNGDEILVLVATMGVNFTQLIAAVLGVLVIGGEYTTGMVRSTFTAVPGRLAAFSAKALIIGVATFIVGLVSIVLTAVVALPILSGKNMSASLTNSDVVGPLIGGAGYLALVAVLAFAIGAILRNTAGGIAAVVGLVLVLPLVLNIVSSMTQATWLRNVIAFLPSEAGGRFFAYHDSSAATPAAPVDSSGIVSLEPWQGLVVLIAWAAIALVVGAVLTKRRDV